MNCIDCHKEIKQKFNFDWRCRKCGYALADKRNAEALRLKNS